MRQWIYATATTLSLAVFGALAPANALPINPGLNTTTDVLQAQFIFGGRNYCFYNNGWNGPGFYWCGYASRRGLGYGGGAGWRGWNHRGPHMGGRPGGRPHVHSRPSNRPHMGGRPGGGRPGDARPGGGHGGGGHHR